MEVRLKAGSILIEPVRVTSISFFDSESRDVVRIGDCSGVKVVQAPVDFEASCSNESPDSAIVSGSVVRLKSGSDPMTVDQVLDGTAECYWQKTAGIEFAAYPISTLDVVEVAERSGPPSTPGPICSVQRN